MAEARAAELDPGTAAPAPGGGTARGAGADVWHQVLRVAWLSIGLGFAIEVLLLMLAAYSGTQGDTPKPFIADLVQKVSWSFIVCVGIAFGTAATRARATTMGLLGLISAPVAFTAAKALHKGVAQALGLAAAGGSLPMTLLIAGVKALEYAFLGAALGRLGKQARSLGAHVGLGLAAGVVFGGVLLLLAMRAAAAPLAPVDLMARGINEVLFPVGCSLVLYAAEAMGKRLPG